MAAMMASGDLSSSPNSIRDLPALFTARGGKKEGDLIHSLAELVEELPLAVQNRKMNDIEPGAANDPICMLFR
jgi:hypothetical protein